MTTILMGVVGSTAYGLNHSGSDIDRLGVFQRPTGEILGRLNKGEVSADTRVSKDPDVTMHELAKAMRLFAEANPNLLELLWLADSGYETINLAGGLLLGHRELFISQRVRNRYVGYARGQIKRLLGRGDFDSQKQTEKHGRHTARLLFQAQSIVETGELRVRLTEDEVETCFEWGRFAVSEPQTFAGHMEDLIIKLDSTPTEIPENPDMAAIRDLLVEIRLMELKSSAAECPA